MSRMTEALHTGEAAGLVAELGIQPAGLGVEPFLRALQAALLSHASQHLVVSACAARGKMRLYLVHPSPLASASEVWARECFSSWAS